MMERPNFRPGKNIALKIPPCEFEKTLGFYRDVLGLRELGECGGSLGFDFDGKQIWLDCVETLSRAEIWLEIRADDEVAAAKYFEACGVIRCDAIEKLPADFEGFWIANAAGLVHLVSCGGE